MDSTLTRYLHAFRSLNVNRTAGRASPHKACMLPPPNPYFPFFHLKNEGFWHLQPLPGREAAVRAMSSARSAAASYGFVPFFALLFLNGIVAAGLR